MRIAFIASNKDSAGKTISQELLASGCKDLYLIEGELLLEDNLEHTIEGDLFIFLSKHRSGSNTKSFAVHSIGNWHDAKAGGKEKTLCPSSAILQHHMFKELYARQREGYEVTMEATHHGPYTEKPAIFVEVGSTEEEWQDPINGKIIAESVIAAIEKSRNATQHTDNEHQKNNQNERKQKEKQIVAIGLGGPHYCNNFNKLSLRKNYAFAHICPKHHLQYMDEDMLGQAIEKTNEKVESIVLDWKGLGKEKQRILEMIQKTGIKIERTDQLLKD